MDIRSPKTWMVVALVVVVASQPILSLRAATGESSGQGLASVIETTTTTTTTTTSETTTTEEGRADYPAVTIGDILTTTTPLTYVEAGPIVTEWMIGALCLMMVAVAVVARETTKEEMIIIEEGPPQVDLGFLEEEEPPDWDKIRERSDELREKDRWKWRTEREKRKRTKEEKEKKKEKEKRFDWMKTKESVEDQWEEWFEE